MGGGIFGVKGRGEGDFSRGLPSGGRSCRKGPLDLRTGPGQWMGRGENCGILSQGSVWESQDLVGEDDERGLIIF